MSGFSIDWLDLRDEADRRARDARLAGGAAALVDDAEHGLVVDLGSGTGATFRALSPLLKQPASWRFVDHDPALLTALERRLPAGTRADTVQADLAAPRPLPVNGARLVTASALFDLTSEAWLARLVATVVSNRAGLYAALSYDGTTSFSPSHPLDETVVAAFNKDQRRDKGFGPALGPAAGEALSDALTRAGYRVAAASTPWRLGRADAALATALVRGMADAVRGAEGMDPAALGEWLAFRIESAGSGITVVGHLDVLGVP